MGHKCLRRLVLVALGNSLRGEPLAAFDEVVIQIFIEDHIRLTNDLPIKDHQLMDGGHEIVVSSVTEYLSRKSALISQVGNGFPLIKADKTG